VEESNSALNPSYWSRGIGEIDLIPSAIELGKRERTMELADRNEFPRNDEEGGIS
jgi:hypothetical protein